MFRPTVATFRDVVIKGKVVWPIILEMYRYKAKVK